MDFHISTFLALRWLQVRPRGPTPTGKRVNDILDAYMSTLRHDRDMKPLNLVVITDGEASDNWLLVRCLDSSTFGNHPGVAASQSQTNATRGLRILSTDSFIS